MYIGLLEPVSPDTVLHTRQLEAFQCRPHGLGVDLGSKVDLFNIWLALGCRACFVGLNVAVLFLHIIVYVARVRFLSLCLIIALSVSPAFQVCCTVSLVLTLFLCLDLAHITTSPDPAIDSTASPRNTTPPGSIPARVDVDYMLCTHTPEKKNYKILHIDH
ncbi:hypothetical protein P3342_012281 [Pyrenophora teres f. teres]|nr:hypothetical protein P3342_012281 [Pyrenophora teres f. teres]